MTAASVRKRTGFAACRRADARSAKPLRHSGGRPGNIGLPPAMKSVIAGLATSAVVGSLITVGVGLAAPASAGCEPAPPDGAYCDAPIKPDGTGSGVRGSPVRRLSGAVAWSARPRRKVIASGWTRPCPGLTHRSGRATTSTKLSAPGSQSTHLRRRGINLGSHGRHLVRTGWWERRLLRVDRQCHSRFATAVAAGIVVPPGQLHYPAATAPFSGSVGVWIGLPARMRLSFNASSTEQRTDMAHMAIVADCVGQTGVCGIPHANWQSPNPPAGTRNRLKQKRILP